MSERRKREKLFAQKDADSFEGLFRLYYPRLRKYAGNYIHVPEEAEDLVQDVFFQVWQNRHQLDAQKNIGSYLFTLLKNRCLNALRHKVVEEKFMFLNAKNPAEELYHISFLETGDFVSMEEQLMEELEKIISQMPEKCRIAFRLKWFEGKKIHEIAGIMKISTTMVDKHLVKGLKIAREKLNPDLFIFFLAGFEKLRN